jgi:hypothetical protein
MLELPFSDHAPLAARWNGRFSEQRTYSGPDLLLSFWVEALQQALCISTVTKTDEFRVEGVRIVWPKAKG